MVSFKRFAGVGLLALIGLVCAPAFAQTTQTASSGQPSQASQGDLQMLRENIRAQRKQVTAQNLQITADQATKFWPLYDQYVADTTKINDQRWALIQNYAANYQSMNGAQAAQYVQQSASIDKQLIDLRTKYVGIFEKVLSPKQAAQWYQIDRRLDLIINLQLASKIPIVNASP
jgi:Spy/CpxP family protein refolding chaperone